MKNLIQISVVLLLVSCYSNEKPIEINNNNKPSSFSRRDTIISIEKKEVSNKTGIIKLSKVDYNITIKKIINDNIFDLDFDLYKNDSLNKIYFNQHQIANIIEQQQLPKFKNYVRKDSNILYVKLTNNEWIPIPINLESDETDNNFENYFIDFGYYSVRTQWGEGNAYKLINTTTGKILDIFGRPYFSPNGKFLISVSNDLEAHYSANGLQVFRNYKDSLKLIYSITPKDWGPKYAFWLNDSSLILKCDTFTYNENDIFKTIFYKLTTKKNN